MRIFRFVDNGLEAARLELVAPGKASFTLFPTIHLADRAFFERVKTDADGHDAVLSEGVCGKQGLFVNRMYRLASGGASNLSAQADVVKSDEDHWYNADIEPDDFQKSWSNVALWRRILIIVASPMAALVLRSRRARLWLSEALVDEEIDNKESMELIGGIEFRKAVLDDRDAVLMSYCEGMMDDWNGYRIAVIWGGGHIPQLMECLQKEHGYRVERTEWITVIAKQEIM